MFFSRKSKKNNKSITQSVLKGQRPRKRVSEATANSTISLFELSALKLSFKVVFLVLLSIGAYVCFKSILNHKDNLEKMVGLWTQNPTVIVEANDGAVFDDKLNKSIFEVVSNHMKAPSWSNLSTLGAALESLGTLENIAVIRPQMGILVIKAGLRKPFLLVAAGDKLRYLTADGTVFGDASDGKTLPGLIRPTVTLTGLFDERGGPFQFDSSSRMLVSPSERTLLMQVISLYESVVQKELSLSEITYHRFRGFTLRSTDNTDIVLGNSPFEHKLQKLKAIQEKLSSRGVTALRIELDYDGKAFVKERKL